MSKSEEIKRDMFTSNGNGLFFVSQRYLSKEYKGTLATWNKCIMLMAAFRLINIIKPSEWKLQRGYLNESQYNSLINASKKYGRPINYYYFDSYSLQHLSDVESRIKHFFDAGGNVAGLCKTMLIDLYGQKEANRITDDSRKRTQDQKQAERIIEKAIAQYKMFQEALLIYRKYDCLHLLYGSECDFKGLERYKVTIHG